MTQPGFTVEGFAAHLIKSEATIRRMIKRGELLAVKYGPRDTRITHEEAERYKNYGIRTDQSGGIREYAEPGK
jgi:hypothetical protein